MDWCARLVRRSRLDDLTVLYLGCCCAPVVRPPSASTDWCARLVRRSRLDDLTVSYLGCCCAPVVRPPSGFHKGSYRIP